jgi:hypothetical protein
MVCTYWASSLSLYMAILEEFHGSYTLVLYRRAVGDSQRRGSFFPLYTVGLTCCVGTRSFNHYCCENGSGKDVPKEILCWILPNKSQRRKSR